MQSERRTALWISRTGRWTLLAATLLTLALVTAGCGEEEPEPKPLPFASFSGVWRGTVLEATSGNGGTLVLTVDQQGTTLNGVWTASYSSGFINGGTLSGTASSDAATANFRLISSEPAYCPLAVTATVDGDEAYGNYVTLECSELATGTLHVIRNGPQPAIAGQPAPDQPAPPPAPTIVTTPTPGLWTAVAYTGAMAKLDLRRTVSTSGNASWSAHGWGFCGGGYCDWGTVPARVLADGRLYAFWQFGFKSTTVWAGMSTTTPGRMETDSLHDFADGDGRADYRMHEVYALSQ